VITLASSVRSVLVSAPEVGSPVKLRREDVLFYQEQAAAALFFIEAGMVKLTRTSNTGRQQIVSVNGAQQLVGEECLCGGEPVLYRSEAECLTDVVVYRIPASAVLRLYGIPDFAAALVSYAIRRDVDFIHKADLLVGHDVNHRILHGLAELARLVPTYGDGNAFPIPMTQAEIASFVGATRETTSTILSLLQKRALVSLSRRLVTTVHPDLLIAAADRQFMQTHAAVNSQN
jgi:CRP/FNR family cyclic AMP-dependent transcriptional regulator